MTKIGEQFALGELALEPLSKSHIVFRWCTCLPSLV